MTSKNKTSITAEPGRQDIIIIREFDAPSELVYRAYTDPELFVQWLGPRGFKMELEKFEPVNGGSYRYIHTDPNGGVYCFHGVFHEVSPHSIIQTFEFEGLPESGHVSLESLKIEPLPGGRTRITGYSIYLTQADRDGMIGSDMEKGVNDGYERLDELLAALQQAKSH